MLRLICSSILCRLKQKNDRFNSFWKSNDPMFNCLPVIGIICFILALFYTTLLVLFVKPDNFIMRYTIMYLDVLFIAGVVVVLVLKHYVFGKVEKAQGNKRKVSEYIGRMVTKVVLVLMLLLGMPIILLICILYLIIGNNNRSFDYYLHFIFIIIGIWIVLEPILIRIAPIIDGLVDYLYRIGMIHQKEFSTVLLSVLFIKIFTDCSMKLVVFLIKHYRRKRNCGELMMCEEEETAFFKNALWKLELAFLIYFFFAAAENSSAFGGATTQVKDVVSGVALVMLYWDKRKVWRISTEVKERN